MVLTGEQVDQWQVFSLRASGEVQGAADGSWSVVTASESEVRGVVLRSSVTHAPGGEPLFRGDPPLSSQPLPDPEVNQEYLVVLGPVPPVPGYRAIVAAYRLDGGRLAEAPPGARVGELLTEYLTER
jgi:hypothetical protein